MKIISWNVNGIRAVEKKGELKSFIENFSPDILCFQEIKAKSEQMEFLEEKFSNYQKFYFSAQKPGYAGTGIWICKKFIEKFSVKNIEFSTGMQNFSDSEGRISQLHFEKNSEAKTEKFSILGVYFPNGGKSPEAWDGPDGKLDFYTKFLDEVNFLRSEEREVIFCGDVNTCHQAIDIARPKANEGKIGFHPLEREKISHWVENSWKDIWREKFPDTADQYSWWSYRGGARDRNVGWRIDYFFVDEKFLPQVKEIKYLNEQKGSDHCPVLLEV